ncbi:tripartite tricarboxylate transporter TctB family protein [Planctomicrobium sp.]|jgi:putative tricarboxylic transport membrane protein|nr:tripartite tricarboxylate transporter TctB family protein [Planctomicrobium sp.]MDA7527699.1 tripartite tricarboxylate transporter TctB family protein [bacterium]MDB4742893.1 tripartite tricarboxylate transporter TctB family protein [Planctomicrobium sp.]
MTEASIENDADPSSPIGTAVFGVMLVTLAIAIFYFSKEIRAFALGESDPGPKALPLICGGLFLFGGLSQLVQAIFVEGLFNAKKFSLTRVSGQFLMTLGILVGYIVSLNLLGYLLSTSLFMLCLLKLFRSRWLEAVVATGVLVSFVYLLFEMVFKVSLPDGILF